MFKKIFIPLLVIVAVIFIGAMKKGEQKQFVPTSTNTSVSHQIPDQTAVAVCGDGFCGVKETGISCPKDCNKYSCGNIYEEEERICLNNGWRKINVNVNGIERELLWKGPQQWKYGAIIAMHGGGGADSNFCSYLPKSGSYFFLSDILRGVPMQEFGELAVKEGFALFSLDSSYNRVSDMNGKSVGKRWDSLKQKGKENIDLPFIEKVITETIPSMRQKGSSNSIFITGISNGGFMTILASTHFSNKITAFAPVSAGDPYSIYFDMSTHPPKRERKCAPGVWRVSETNVLINVPNVCVTDKYPNDTEWPVTKASRPFKQFHNTGDGLADFSCMQRVRKLLVEHGYKDEGAFIINSDRRNTENHFWQREYNQQIIEFFKKHTR